MRAVEVPKWLQGLPSAPEFRPTDTEFADPIAYISKIEKEASAFGICKVIPPLPKPSKKYVLYNLNRTLAKCPELGSDVDIGSVKNSESGGGEIRAAFTTRQQELGQSGKKVKGEVETHSMGGPRQVWQSGETYTLDQFETKSKNFAKNQLSAVKEVSPLVIEAMFWKATSEKPIYVEYANDVPGSGFGEPEESFQYLHRKRRRRRKRGAFCRNNRESSSSKNYQVEKDNTNMGKDLEVINSSRQASSSSTCFPTDQSRAISTEKDLQAANEMVGTAGWKLANSPWNLQVIARSPGSLTRFMPDDIPGVTSPMVYIGMLFSWFAWHVEDHELHSLNYLHMGSPKTWYAVPGNYAFTFEEAIRLHAYGDNTDHIDALSLLGEKTTLLSPEIIVASGIPCCRLIQNPGEFVVTFPRAYHVGFSHGFNCGEAANFATPMWLSVAKEAAVRRAAMNYLPMLSHQQLLYLLTMSFISRVPRSLLPGARSSRLRDRQKEEREHSVKKAFVEDILKENHLLTILLKKNPSYHVVKWDLDLLPSSSKQPEPCSKTDTIATTLDEKDQSQDYPTQDLYSKMNCYMDSVNDFYVDDADHLLCEYQADSGTLPCVACGILGFPFMAVVQPTDQASRDLLAEDAAMTQQFSTLEAVDSLPLGLNGRVEESVGGVTDTRGTNLFHPLNQASSSAELSQLPSSPTNIQLPGTGHSLFSQEVMGSSANTSGNQWNLSLRSSRPRVFCLKHAIQTVDLLCLRGGANVLGLCHSDFQKIKAHAAVVAEEIGSLFTFNEIPLDNASQEDLCMIDHATDEQEKYESIEDWTSKLCINLQHCVKMRKNSQKVHHALGLDGLPSDAGSSAWKWRFKRPRSKQNLVSPIIKKTCLSKQTMMVRESVPADAERGREEERPIIRYYRKKYRLVSRHQEVTKTSVDTDSLPPREPAAGCVNPNREFGVGSENTPARGEHAGNGPLESSSLPSGGIPAKQDEDEVASNPFTSEGVVASLAITTLIPQHIVAPGGSISSLVVEKNNEGDLTFHHSEELSENLVAEKNIHKDDKTDSKSSFASGNLLISSPEDTGAFKGSKTVAEINGAIKTHDLVWTDEPKEQHDTHGEADATEETSIPGNSCSVVHDTDVASVFIHHAHTETTEVDKQDTTSRLLKHSTPKGKVQEEKQMSGEGHEVVPISRNPPGTYKMQETGSYEQLHGIEDIISSLESQESDDNFSIPLQSEPNAKAGRKRKREANMLNEVDLDFGGFIRSPCEGLRPRAKRDGPYNQHDLETEIESKAAVDRMVSKISVPCDNKKGQQKKGRHRCDIENCRMSFQTKTELATHKRNRCHVEGCGKKFNSHKYAMLHQRVHEDDRPLKCTWEGCKMTFKWAWARTEHFRVHTGERPYKCKVEGCGLTFRFVSDFSRHRRKTAHYV